MGWLDTLANVGGDLLSGYLGGQTAEDAADKSTEALSQGKAASEAAVAQGRSDVLGTTQPALADLLSGYQGALGVTEQQGPAEQMSLALSGALGPEAQQAAQQNFLQSPGQQFLQSEQERALLRNQGAIGGLGGGNVRSALQDQAYGRAATFQQQNLTNLMNLAIPEQQRASNLANILQGGGQNIAALRTGTGTNLANLAMGGAAQQIPLYSQIGATQAAGALGYGNALQQGVGNAGKTLGSLGA